MTHTHTHFDAESMSNITPFWRLLTVFPSSLGSSDYLQNRFCQAHWCIMHWHQWAYFHFNNTEIFLLLRAFFFFFSRGSLWQNESGMEMIKQPFVSGHVSSVYLSEPLQRGWANEREPWLEGLSPKQHQITCFFLFLPVQQRDMSQSNTVCQGIPRQLMDPTTNWSLMSCHLLSLPCPLVVRQITRNIPEKFRVAPFMQCGTCHGIYLALLEPAREVK